MGVGETPLPELQWHEQWRGLDVNDFRPSPLNVGQKKCHFGHFLGKKKTVKNAKVFGAKCQKENVDEGPGYPPNGWSGVRHN